MTEHLRHDPRQPLLRRDNRPYAASVFYDRTQSYTIVFTAITVALLISAALTALLIKPWARLGRSARMSIQ